MITKGKDIKVQKEVITQISTYETVKRLNGPYCFLKKKSKKTPNYYNYFRQNINLDESIKKVF